MSEQNLVTVGQISAVFGVRGWLKVHSYTDPIENLLTYKRFLLEKNGQLQTVNIDSAKRHGEGLIVHIDSVNDRDQAREVAPGVFGDDCSQADGEAREPENPNDQ